MTTIDPRYPVGKFKRPESYSDASRAAAIQSLAELPAAIRAATAGLTEAQLDTPYREGGWTLRQVIHHLADSHMNAYIRTRFVVTEDKPTVKPYSEAVWAELPDAKSGPVEPSLRILDGEIRLLPLRTRMPFKYGIATMTDVPHAFVRVRCEIADRIVEGISADLLPPKWFTKDPLKPIAAEIDEMLEVIRHALAVAGADGGDLPTAALHPGAAAQDHEELGSGRALGDGDNDPGKLIAHAGLHRRFCSFPRDR